MSKHLKIFYLITKSNYGGAQKYIFQLAERAQEVGYDVVVGCGGTGEAGATTGLLVQKLKDKKIPTYHIKSLSRDVFIWSDIKTFLTICKLLRLEKPDVLHVTSSKVGGLGSLAGRLVRIKKIIFTSHGLTCDETWRPKWQILLITIITWLTIKLSHHSIMISTENLNRTKNWPLVGKKVFLIKNGIEKINFLPPANAKADLLQKINNLKTSPQIWIGGIGELHPNKNWLAVIIAMKSIPTKAHLFIIGAGEEKKSLQQTIIQHDLENRVHLLEYIEDAAKYLKAFDIFVLPSKKEGLPYVLLEAGLASLATVASDLPGNRDIIKNGETGILIKPNPKLLSTSISMLIQNSSMRRHYGTTLKNKINTEFSIQSMFKKTIHLYKI